MNLYGNLFKYPCSTRWKWFLLITFAEQDSLRLEWAICMCLLHTSCLLAMGSEPSVVTSPQCFKSIHSKFKSKCCVKTFWGFQLEGELLIDKNTFLKTWFDIILSEVSSWVCLIFHIESYLSKKRSVSRWGYFWTPQTSLRSSKSVR